MRELEATNHLWKDAAETEKFCRIFDRFFDCMNTRNLKEGKMKRKPDLRAYFSQDDARLKWLEEDFLGYLKDWKLSVNSRTEFSDGEKKRMLLPESTVYGLHMTVYSFVELAKSLLSSPAKCFLFSERFNQDPLEAFFGKQRARGGRSDNPTVSRFLQNTQAIRVVRSLAIGGSSNVKRALNFDFEELCEPLKKKPRS